MRPAVLVDANIVISLMLSFGNRPGPITNIFDAGLIGALDLLIGEDTFSEVRSSIRAKPYLRRLEPVEAVVIASLRKSCSVLPPVQPPMSRHCRDPRDDYLIALALANAATHLLTGDRDLLALDDGRFPFRILDAAELARELGIPEDA